MGGRAQRIPTPPTMQNHGYYIASMSEIVRWLGEKAEGMGVNIFTGFPVASLVMEGDKVIGVRTTPTGLMRDGEPGKRIHSANRHLRARHCAVRRNSRIARAGVDAGRRQ